MTRTLLILGTGTLGAAIGARFVAEGWRVVGVRRTPDEGPGPFPVIAADVGDPDALARLHEQEPDAAALVVAAYPGLREGVPNPIPPCLSACGRLWPDARLVYTGSTQVYADAGGGLVDERAPLTDSPIARAFLDAEAAVLDRPGAVVLRLGQLVSRDRVASMAARLAGRERLEVPGDPGRAFNLVHERDVADVVLAAATDPSWEGVYNCAAPTSIGLADWYARLAALDGRTLEVVGDERPATNRRIDSTRVRNALGDHDWIDAVDPSAASAAG